MSSNLIIRTYELTKNITEYSAAGSVSVLGTGGHVFNSHYSDFSLFLGVIT